jgi:hypothetical protein
VVTNDMSAALECVRRFRTGTVNVNEVPGYRIECSPFGGVKDSGLGIKEGVIEAMLRDLGSRDIEFIQIVKDIREQLLAIAGISQSEGYECVFVQGSGTFGIEAVLTCAVPREGK